MCVFMTHIGGKPPCYAKGIAEKLESLKPDIFICGHSHILKVTFDKKHNLLFMNPGSVGKHGFHKKQTMISFEITAGKLVNLIVIELGENPRKNL